jgi:hypothetical protein
MTTVLATRGATWPTQVDMVVEHCCACGMPFAMPKDVRDELLEHSSASELPTKSFYCPAGHQQHYTGPTREQRLRAEKEALEQRLQWARESDERNRQRALRAERSAAALRGVVTRTKSRVGKGVCPCCNRTFTALQRHMATQHPEYVDSPDVPPTPAEVRAWARDQGLPVADRGAIPAYITRRYAEAALSAEGSS